ncbi:hypothetical protein ACMA1D_05165, partial [Streptomyces sp. 796.1]
PGCGAPARPVEHLMTAAGPAAVPALAAATATLALGGYALAALGRARPHPIGAARPAAHAPCLTDTGPLGRDLLAATGTRTGRRATAGSRTGRRADAHPYDRGGRQESAAATPHPGARHPLVRDAAYTRRATDGERRSAAVPRGTGARSTAPCDGRPRRSRGPAVSP